MKTYWEVDQADATRLRQIVRDEFAQPLDLVIDDASHLYGPTKASFETLFPLVRSGGVYVIEDWGWEHDTRPDPSERGDPPTRLVLDLVRAVATHERGAVAELLVAGPVVAAVRGWASLPEDFSLDDYIQRPAGAEAT